MLNDFVGEVVRCIKDKTLFRNLWRMAMLELLQVSHSWISYVHTDFRIALYSSNILTKNSFDFVPRRVSTSDIVCDLAVFYIC